MCYNCGCAIPDDDMGHPENITEKTLESLAGKKNKTKESIKKKLAEDLRSNSEDLDSDIKEIFDRASKVWGQPIDEAKKNTLSLLTQQGN